MRQTHQQNAREYFVSNDTKSKTGSISVFGKVLEHFGLQDVSSSSQVFATFVLLDSTSWSPMVFQGQRTIQVDAWNGNRFITSRVKRTMADSWRSHPVLPFIRPHLDVLNSFKNYFTLINLERQRRKRKDSGKYWGYCWHLSQKILKERETVDPFSSKGFLRKRLLWISVRQKRTIPERDWERAQHLEPLNWRGNCNGTCCHLLV